MRYFAIAIWSCLLFFNVNIVEAKPIPNSFADVAETLIPSVVNISTTSKVVTTDVKALGVPGSGANNKFDDMFKQYFGDDFVLDGMTPTQKKVTSLGSGYIFNSKGFIVTNNHVIDGAEKITITLSNEEKYEAKVIGFDKKTDIALLKIEPKSKLTPVKLGNSDYVRVGDWVLAVGNPFGLGGTVTAGIISAKSRDINSGPYDNYLQTDASINRGNSGGPMFNIKGELIGMNTAIFSTTGGSVGIGFAVPVNMVKWVVERLEKDGEIKRGWIGVTIQSTTDEIAKSLGLDKTQGAIVSNVAEGGPADVAGIQAGDIIISFDAKNISKMRTLPLIVAETPIGKKVRVIVWRDNKRKILSLKVGELAKESVVDIDLTDGEKDKNISDNLVSFPEVGIKAVELNDLLRSRYRIDKTSEGLLILDVEDGSSAQEKQLRKGDLIVKANQTEINSADDFRKVINGAKEDGAKPILLLIEDNTGLHFVAVKVE